MLDDKINKFLEEAGPVFFVTPTIERAIGLEKILPDFHIICAQDSNSIELLKESGVKIFCLKKDIKNAGKILSEIEVCDYIKRNAGDKTPNVITFKPSPMIEKVCEKNGFRYLGNDSKINREWEDKINFAEITTALGVNNANSRILKIEKDGIEDLSHTFDFAGNKKYVIQLSRGYSGNSTFIIDSTEKLQMFLEANVGRKIKIADFVAGDTYTFDVCVGGFGFFVSQPIFQITGFPELNRNNLGTCGNDYTFGNGLSRDIKDGFYSSIKKVVDKISSAGYRGILGFDFVVGSGGVHLIEVNPRLVGSIPVFTKLQLRAGEIPFLLLHMLSFLDFDFSTVEMTGPRQDFVFSQLLFRNTASESLRVEKSGPSGVYTLNGDSLEFVKEAYFIDEDALSGQFFLNLAPEGAIISPDMEYADIQIPCGIMETRSSFKEEFASIERIILKNIILK